MFCQIFRCSWNISDSGVPEQVRCESPVPYAPGRSDETRYHGGHQVSHSRLRSRNFVDPSLTIFLTQSYGFRKHEWFQKDLPTYLFPSPVEQDSSVIDIDAVNEVCEKFNVKEAEVHSALLSSDRHDHLAIAYHLIIDNKRIADEAAKAELKDFYVASSPPPVAFSPNDATNSPLRPHPERIARELKLFKTSFLYHG